MNERYRDHTSRPSRRGPARSTVKGRRPSRRPTIEALEGRALLSVAGGPDFTYAPNDPYYTSGGFARVEFQPGNIDIQSSIITGQAIEPDGSAIEVGYLLTNPVFGGNTTPLSSIQVVKLTPAGTFDATFGTAANVTLPAGVGADSAQAVALQSDGKIVVLADVSPDATGSTPQVSLYRLNANGSTDTTFGTNGVVTFSFDKGTTAVASSARALTIDSNGDLLVGGLATGSGVAFARFTATGAPDTTFGTNGQVIVPFTSGTTTLANTQGVAALAIQTGGAIDYDTTVVPTSGTGTQIAVGQLTALGVPDTTFGTGGQMILAGSSSDTAGALAIQTDGKLIVGGAYFFIDSGVTTSTTHFDVYRLNTDGTIDTAFGTMGEVTPVVTTRPLGTIEDNATRATVSAILIQPDGKILVGGDNKTGSFSEGTPTVVRLNTDGSIDTGYGTAGVSSFDPPAFDPSESEILDSVFGLGFQPDGKVVVSTRSGVARLLASGATNDFDNDGKTDLSVLLTNFKAPIFAYRPSSGAAGSPDVLEAFGTTGAGLTLPAPGAYSGEGISELGVYLPAIGAFAYRSYAGGSFGSSDSITFIGEKGIGNSIPAQADYDGSGHTEFAVYEPDTGSLVYQSSTATDVTVPFGTPGAGNSIPAPADYDGAGHDEIAVYLPALAAFAYRPANGGADVIIPFGSAGIGNSIPVPGDYDGSGHTELAVYLPALGAFAYRPYNGGPDVIVPFGSAGAGNSIPAPGDYDGSGHTELAVYLPNLSAFAYRPYSGGPDVIISFGEPGAGNTIPFTATGAATIDGGGGNGPTARPGSLLNSYIDFVPEIAGAAKKKDAGSASTSPASGQS